MPDCDFWYDLYREHGGQLYGPYWHDYNADARRAANRECCRPQVAEAYHECELVELGRSDDRGRWLYTCRLHGGEITVFERCGYSNQQEA